MTPAPQQQGVRVVSKDTATKVSQMLEEVVGPHGTGLKAKIDGYRVAGKTGTADRYDPRSAATAASPPRSSGMRRRTTRSTSSP